MDFPDALRPRIVLHTPLGATVLDPLGPGEPVSIPGISYEVVVGDPQLPDTVNPGALIALLFAAVVAGSAYLGWAMRGRR